MNGGASCQQKHVQNILCQVAFSLYQFCETYARLNFVDGKVLNGRFSFEIIFFEEAFIMPKIIKTGGTVPVSGQYRPQGSRHEYTFVEGKRVPPTASGSTKFVLVDQTKHKGGK